MYMYSNGESGDLLRENELLYMKTATMQRCHSSLLVYINVISVCIKVSLEYVKVSSVGM